ncbi:AMP-dependent synthetase and ligase [Emticicia oligotrophica DSM 17448]|uniref:AMP-dependent synthetase and ligase n=1 Tax=Emticicia oligotrophica (strain DSM 17448 / CIP 109782 / MTCC 6937 / GPTSA100-15) TaxID=929562 RepID=A0ABN4AC46_EMTOG|nr:acyl-CoA synthetase [Emticicia oligotrophica]AFK01772.1 AMP-dependent synthetase and ligase [Emticicia oligotrophica DSM 17448]
MLKLVKNANLQPGNQAIISDNQSYTYQNLLDSSEKFASLLLEKSSDLNETRVAFMVSPGFDYVSIQWGIWRAGGIAVPLCISYPLPSLQYVIEDTGAEIVIAGAEYAEILKPLAAEKGFRYIILPEVDKLSIPSKKLPNIQSTRKAMILYTSGTTNLPKGVVTTHANIEAQISTLVKSWKWSAQDHVLCVLPLHHVHGIINVISCALWSGATVEFLPSFSAEGVFGAFQQGKINLFMAVPTIYFKLIAHWESLPIDQQKQISDTLAKFRLMVSGSAALPVSVMEKWKNISTHTLLERYGMTEIGMGISNPYDGERKAGYIGKPLSGVKARLVDENNQVVKRGQPGEIQIKGKNVFLEYWNKPEATQKTFTADGWFKTGDVAVVEKGYYRILGRDSIDIIKSGGYKISALEIEEILRTHPAINDCSVVGVPNDEWGELVAAAIIVNDPNLDLKALNAWMREKMPAYKTPRQYKIVEELPRNAMGKVTKNDLKKMFI